VDIWQQKGIKSLVGIDIIVISARELSAKYPSFGFYEADITSEKQTFKNYVQTRAKNDKNCEVV